jgi:hypothetical protein
MRNWTLANLSYGLMRALPQHRQLETEKIERWVERKLLSILKFRFFTSWKNWSWNSNSSKVDVNRGFG